MLRLPARIAVAVLVTSASLAFAFSSGPPDGRTGAPAVAAVTAEPSCRDCHTSFALNLAGATLQILDVPPFYWPDSLYTIRVRMTSTFGAAAQRRWGFELTAVTASDGQGVGTFDVTGIPTLQLVAGTDPGKTTRRYVMHTSAGTFPGTAGPTEWAFKWRPPATDVGRIYFYAAGNASNNNFTTSGDHIYTAGDTSDINPLVDAPAPPLHISNALSAARPNPFHAQTTVDYALVRDGAVDLAVFDLQGRRLRTLLSGKQPAGAGSVSWDGTADDGRRIQAGVYFVRLAGSGGQGPITRKVMLAP